jgi:hypothetical protein
MHFIIIIIIIIINYVNIIHTVYILTISRHHQTHSIKYNLLPYHTPTNALITSMSFIT